MLNYLRAEFYKVIHRKYVWITLGVGLLLEALLVFSSWFTNINGNDLQFSFGISLILSMGTIGFIATLLTGDMVIAGQYKHATLKNEVSFGLSRSRIYLGKLAAQCILSILFMAVMVGFFTAASWATLYHDPEQDAQAWKTLLYFLAAAFPLWMGVQALTCSMFFLISSEVAGVLISLGTVIFLPQIIYLMMMFCRDTVQNVLLQIYLHLPPSMVDGVREQVGNWAYCGKAWLVGVIWFAVFTVLGLYGFYKKEIK